MLPKSPHQTGRQHLSTNRPFRPRTKSGRSCARCADSWWITASDRSRSAGLGRFNCAYCPDACVPHMRRSSNPKPVSVPSLPNRVPHFRNGSSPVGCRASKRMRFSSFLYQQARLRGRILLWRSAVLWAGQPRQCTTQLEAGQRKSGVRRRYSQARNSCSPHPSQLPARTKSNNRFCAIRLQGVTFHQAV